MLFGALCPDGPHPLSQASTLTLFVDLNHAKPALFAAAARATERKLPRPKEAPPPPDAVGAAIEVVAAIARSGHAAAV